MKIRGRGRNFDENLSEIKKNKNSKDWESFESDGVREKLRKEKRDLFFYSFDKPWNRLFNHYSFAYGML